MPLLQTIAAGLVLAFVLGALALRARLSPMVGYLLAGVVIGPHTPGFVADQAIANQLSEIGVILLMFGVGLHFSLRDLVAVRAIAVPGAVTQIAIATGLGAGLAWLLGWPGKAGLMYGLALSVASTVVLLRALEQRRQLESPQGKIAVGWLIVEDLAMVLALVLLPAFADPGGGARGHPGLGALLGLTAARVAGFLALMLVVGRRVIPWLLARVAGQGSHEMFTLAVLAIALGLALGSAQLFQVSFALGAFFAGMLLNESELSHRAARDSLPLRDAFTVMFFVAVGMQFDPAILVAQPLAVLGTLLIIIVGKSLAALAIVLAFRHPLTTALTIAASLAQIGEFSFILAALGVDLDLLPASGQNLILAGAILSIASNPLLFAALARWRAGRGAAAALAAAGPTPDDGPLVLLVGFGRVGTRIGRILRDRGVSLLVVDADPDAVHRAHAMQLPALLGNAADPRVLAEVGPARIRLALLAIANVLESAEIVARLRAARPDMTIIARGGSDTEVQHLLKHGADGTVVAEQVIALRMADMAASTLAYHARIAAGERQPDLRRRSDDAA